jgi:hypothetical protein
MNVILLCCVVAMSIGTSIKAMDESVSIYTLEEQYSSDHETFFKKAYKHLLWIEKNAKQLNPTEYNTEINYTELTCKALKSALSQEKISTITKEVDNLPN